MHKESLLNDLISYYVLDEECDAPHSTIESHGSTIKEKSGEFIVKKSEYLTTTSDSNLECGDEPINIIYGFSVPLQRALTAEEMLIFKQIK